MKDPTLIRQKKIFKIMGVWLQSQPPKHRTMSAKGVSSIWALFFGCFVIMDSQTQRALFSFACIFFVVVWVFFLFISIIYEFHM